MVPASRAELIRVIPHRLNRDRGKKTGSEPRPVASWDSKCNNHTCTINRVLCASGCRKQPEKNHLSLQPEGVAHRGHPGNGTVLPRFTGKSGGFETESMNPEGITRESLTGMQYSGQANRACRNPCVRHPYMACSRWEWPNDYHAVYRVCSAATLPKRPHQRGQL